MCFLYSTDSIYTYRMQENKQTLVEMVIYIQIEVCRKFYIIDFSLLKNLYNFIFVCMT